jgi:hypothetical protein
MKDSAGVVQSSVVGLADCAKISVPECREALRVLMSPDKEDTSGVDDGRRIREVPGGWEIINHELYRFSSDAKRAYWAERKAIQRSKQKILVMTPKDLAAYEEGKSGEYVKRKKSNGVRKSRNQGQKDGAVQAIKEGFEDKA